MTLVGIPDFKEMVRDLHAWGYWSCQEAEDKGCIITHHQPTRETVDKILANIKLMEGAPKSS